MSSKAKFGGPSHDLEGPVPPNLIVRETIDNGTHGVRNLSVSKINLIVLFAFFSTCKATVFANLKCGPSLSLFLNNLPLSILCVLFCFHYFRVSKSL